MSGEFQDWQLIDAIAAAGMVDDDEDVAIPTDLVILDFLSGTATAAERESVEAAFDGSESFRRHVESLARELEQVRPSSAPASSPAPLPVPVTRTWWHGISALAAVITVAMIGLNLARVGLDPGGMEPSLRLSPVVLGHVFESDRGTRGEEHIFGADPVVTTNQGVLPIRLHVTDSDGDYRYAVRVEVERAAGRLQTLLDDDDVPVATSGDVHVIHVDLVLTAPLPDRVLIELHQYYRTIDTPRARFHQEYVIDLDRP